jgi:hypothetical protein
MPLANPQLVAHSQEALALLDLTPEEVGWPDNYVQQLAATVAPAGPCDDRDSKQEKGLVGTQIHALQEYVFR